MNIKYMENTHICHRINMYLILFPVSQVPKLSPTVHFRCCQYCVVFYHIPFSIFIEVSKRFPNRNIDGVREEMVRNYLTFCWQFTFCNGLTKCAACNFLLQKKHTQRIFCGSCLTFYGFSEYEKIHMEETTEQQGKKHSVHSPLSQTLFIYMIKKPFNEDCLTFPLWMCIPCLKWTGQMCLKILLSLL